MMKKLYFSTLFIFFLTLTSTFADDQPHLPPSPTSAPTDLNDRMTRLEIEIQKMKESLSVLRAERGPRGEKGHKGDKGNEGKPGKGEKGDPGIQGIEGKRYCHFGKARLPVRLTWIEDEEPRAGVFLESRFISENEMKQTINLLSLMDFPGLDRVCAEEDVLVSLALKRPFKEVWQDKTWKDFDDQGILLLPTDLIPEATFETVDRARMLLVHTQEGEGLCCKR